MSASRHSLRQSARQPFRPPSRNPSRQYAPPVLVTRDNLSVRPEHEPWVSLYRRHCLPVLARELAAIQDGTRPPCLFIHGRPDAERRLLATAMVRESGEVWCLDCIALGGECQPLVLDWERVVLDGCAVLVIHGIELLTGEALQCLYDQARCTNTVLILLGRDGATARRIGFALPHGAAIYVLNREDGLVADRVADTRVLWPAGVTR